MSDERTNTGEGDYGGGGEGEPFQSSDLTVPTERIEGWRKLSQQMVPSNGPGSSHMSSGKDTVSGHDAQYLRKLSLVVYSSGTGGSSEDGLELSELRVNFNIKHAQAGSPAILNCRIYNMAPATMAKVIQFTRIQIKAGYKFAGFGKIFDGTVIQYRRGKENPTDTYLEIHGADGDDRANAANFERQYPVGTEDSKIIRDVAEKLGSIGYIDPEIGAKTTKQKDETIAEPARQKLRELMQKHNAKFFFEDGKINIIKADGTIPGGDIILAPNTGLVGLPEVTPQGIEVKCLLNPKIKIGGKIKLSTDVLSGVPFTPGSAVKADKNGSLQGNSDSSAGPGVGSGGKTANSASGGHNLETAYTSPIGTYKVVFLEHTGDTRGTPWYCNIVGVALDANGAVLLNPSSAFRRAAEEVFKTTKTVDKPPLPIPPLPAGPGEVPSIDPSHPAPTMVMSSAMMAAHRRRQMSPAMLLRRRI